MEVALRIPVITLLSPQAPLVESATAYFEHRQPESSLSSARMPGGLAIDPSVPAVPLGLAGALETKAEALRPGRSGRFAVRALIEAPSLADVPAEIDGQPIFVDPNIAPFLTCGGTPPVGTADLVAQKLEVPLLTGQGMDGTDVAIAVMDTGINLDHLQAKLGRMPKVDAANSWSVPGSSTAPFQHPLDHGTMCAYDTLICAPNATLLDFPILRNNAPGGSRMGGTLSVALAAFAHVLSSWAVSFDPGGLRRYKALVISNSWGIFHPSWDFPPGHPGRYCDNPNHPFNIIVGTLAGSDADIVFAAGNCGAQCADMRCQGRTAEAIMGASAHPDVLSLAGCDTKDMRVGYSSQGPSIMGMDPEKPDLITYTHFLGSESFGPGSADSGTSTACPVAAGGIAALRTKLPATALPSPDLFGHLIAAARKRPGQPGWDPGYGHGFLDLVAAAQRLGVLPSHDPAVASADL